MESQCITRNMRRLLERYQNLRGKCCSKSKNGSASVMWDAVVITTADEAQRQAFQQQIQDKEERKELPLDLPIHVVSDPPGPRIGNGGSTLVALEYLQSVYGESGLSRLKVLLIHAGGWSQRLPSATILGKIFAAIPHGSPVYQMLDLKLAMYLPLVPRISPGVLLVCADDFLVYDLGEGEDGAAGDWSVPSSGYTALAHPSPISVGRTHGVYVLEDAEQMDTRETVVVAKCLEVLQKPSDERMKSRGALLKAPGGANGRFEFADGIRLEGEVVYTDSSFYFGMDVVKKLLRLKKEIGNVSCEIDAYGDFLQALGPRATDAYIFNTSNISHVTSDLTQVRQRVFNAMRGCDIHLLVLNASKFIHIGTTGELIHHLCKDGEFRSQMALGKDVFNCWLDNSQEAGNSSAGEDRLDGAQGCVMHSVMPRSSVVSPSSVVEYCRFDVPVTVEGSCIVSNCQWLGAEGSRCSLSDPVVLPSQTFLHTVSVLHQGVSQYVTIFFHISDNLKTSVPASDLASLPFLGAKLGLALQHWRLSKGVVLPEVKTPDADEARVSLWTLKLYPGASSMTESLSLALDMVSSVRNQHSLSRAWEPAGDQAFFSLSDALAQKDVTTMLSYRRQLFDQIQSGMTTL